MLTYNSRVLVCITRVIITKDGHCHTGINHEFGFTTLHRRSDWAC